MSNRFGGLLEKDFAYVLSSLAVIAASVLAIFNILTTTRLSTEMGLTFFVVVTILLILGYALGVVALAFLGIFILTRIQQRKRKAATKTT
jgi:predicted permease